jgi:hypothetical protein
MDAPLPNRHVKQDHADPRQSPVHRGPAPRCRVPALPRRRGRLFTRSATIALAARRSEQESARIRGDRRLSPRFQALVPETERRSAPSRRSPQTKRHRCAAPFRDGASRTRTGDLLGAIQARALRFPPKKVRICRSFARPSAAPLGAGSCGCPRITLAFRHSSRLVPEPDTDRKKAPARAIRVGPRRRRRWHIRGARSAAKGGVSGGDVRALGPRPTP